MLLKELMSTRPAAFDIKRKGPFIESHVRFQPAVDISFLIITYPIRKLDYAKIIGDVVSKTIQY